MDESPRKKQSYYEMLLRLAGHLQSASFLLEKILAEPNRRDELLRPISETDKDAADLAHEITARLHRSLVTPLDRDDLRALATGIGGAVDCVHDVARTIATERISEVDDPARRLGDRLRSATAEINSGITHLWQSDVLLKAVQEIKRFDADASTIHEQAVRNLFAGERDPLEVIKKKDLYEKLVEAVCASGEVASTLESVALKQR